MYSLQTNRQKKFPCESQTYQFKLPPSIEHPLPYQSKQWLTRKTSNAIPVDFVRIVPIAPIPLGAYVPSDNFTSTRTLGGRVAKEARLVIAAGFAHSNGDHWVDYCSVKYLVAILPTNIFLHDQQLLTTPCTSLPPPELTQLQALCGTEYRGTRASSVRIAD